ncbi:hypothetical protein [Streptomyces cucumeris]|uniref:hypothetical protein n=1 Tax=Streptomyces cucumeris TaxID=2962890 RepID=UPI0020C93049|nr:hypothetical protein [Streptomyces sp. NEAU-Y11]MCP9206726.1 hypothetical protein [Streptomyces sp. NEAU-Y11]
MSWQMSTGNPYGAIPGTGSGSAHPASVQPLPGYPLRPRPSPVSTDKPGGAFPYAAPEQPVCQVCAGAPAARMAVRHHQGLIVFVLFRKRAGRFCRVCGTAVFRQGMTRTLWQGWWNPLSALLFNPLTLLLNLRVRATLNSLSKPGDDLSGTRLSPGKPLLRRPMALLGLVPTLGVLCFLVLLAVDVVRTS